MNVHVHICVSIIVWELMTAYMLSLTSFPYRFLVISLLSAGFLLWSILSFFIPAEMPFLPCRKNPSDSKGPGRAFARMPAQGSESSLVQLLPELHWLWVLFATLLEVCVRWLSCPGRVGGGGATVTRMLVLHVQLGHLEAPPGEVNVKLKGVTVAIWNL